MGNAAVSAGIAPGAAQDDQLFGDRLESRGNAPSFVDEDWIGSVGSMPTIAELA